MTTKLKSELFIEDNLGNESIIYPFVESNHVSFGNGMTIKNMIEQDVTTPTVNHDMTSFKVGVGDSDISNSVVDSSVGSMVIKGQTYQNILPDPSLRNKTNGNAMQKFNEGHDDVNVVDGLVKSAILSGQTLVNLGKVQNGWNVNGYHYQGSHKGITNNGEYIRYTSIGESVCPCIRLYDKHTSQYNTVYQLKTNAKYMALVKLNVFSNSVNSLYVSPTGYNTTDGLYGKTSLLQGLQIAKVVFTTPSSFDNNVNIGTNLYTTSGDYVDLYWYQLFEYQEDMENWDIPYFTGMTSCKMPVLSSIGKNLWKGSSWTNDKSIASQGQLIDEVGTNSTVSGFYDVSDLEVGKTYSIPILVDGASGITIAFYDKNKQFTRRIFDMKLTLTDGEKFIRVKTSVATSDKFQLEEGTVATTYEAHKSNILSLSEEIVLRSLPSGMYDTYNVITKEYVQRVEEVVLNGSEDWVLIGSSYQPTDTSLISFDYSTKCIAGTQILCDKLPVRSSGTASPDISYPSVVMHSTGTTIRLCIKKENASTVVGLKTWLQSNPVTVQYELATPVVKTVGLSSIDQDGSDTGGVFKSYSDGHIQLSSGVENSLIPNIDYEVPTSNSYHLDLAKPSTKYTMKNMTGTFTVDGVQYNASANDVFTTPSTMTNKLMVTSAVQSNHMILDGDVTSNTIPYFKGIKSAFENEDKIEVLSTGKNLFDGEVELGRFGSTGLPVENSNCLRSKNFIRVPSSNQIYLSISNNGGYGYAFYWYDKNKNFISETSSIDTKPQFAEFVKFRTSINKVENDLNVKHWIHVYEGSSTSYEPFKSNDVKIPLLKPLRSLLSGICDEIIVNQQENKAKIIRRVDIVDGKLVQLATPTTIEVDIEGFPYVYKNGHIFLNTEIAPKTTIKYSINQSHVIESQNSDLIRHEKETDYLYKLIGEYVRVSYESTLLTLNLELK